MRLLDRIFRRTKREQTLTPNDMVPEAFEKIVQDYGAVLGSNAPAPGCVADVQNLPHSKERIKQALIFALGVTSEPEIREHLKAGYISLADWQEGVGSGAAGIDFTRMDPGTDALEFAKQIVAQKSAMEKWAPIVQAEQEALKSELQKLGLWAC